MKTRYHFSRQRAQLKHLGKQLLQLRENGTTVPNELTAKFRHLCRKLLPRFGTAGLKQALGSAALLIGLGTAVQAQNFAPPVVDAFGVSSELLEAGYYNYPAFADLDNDGDLDLMTTFSLYDYGTEQYTTQFFYFENVGTAEAPDFAAPQINPFGIPVFQSDINPIELVDLDGDGDLDIVTSGFNYENGTYGDGAIFTINNEGNAANPAFGDVNINSLSLPVPGATDNALFFAFGDLDGDGDLDILGNAYDADGYNGFINYYYENEAIDGGILPAAPQIDPFGLPVGNTLDNLNPFSDLADVDNDGDLDLIAGSISYDYGTGLYDNKFLFYENSGTSTDPVFEEPLTNPFGITVPNEDSDEAPRSTFVDIDADGDLDLLFFLDSKLFFQENTLASSLREQSDRLDLSLAPNPTNGLAQITTTEVVARIEVSNLMGQHLSTLNGNQASLDLSDQPAGIYLVKIVTEDDRFQVIRLRKQ
ncbi:hypothetical protein CEQ90_01090 [Lewinellaceae bacterium SD302]|nr:hypothetical protein CEQ90_01090 [Lewinellaceae bacterium SD302]